MVPEDGVLVLTIDTSLHCRISVSNSLDVTICKSKGAFCAPFVRQWLATQSFQARPINIRGGAHLNTCQPQLILTAKQQITLNLTHNCRLWWITQCCTALCLLPRLGRPLRRSFFVALLSMNVRKSDNVHQSCFNYCTI